MPKALGFCPKSIKSPNLVTLTVAAQFISFTSFNQKKCSNIQVFTLHYFPFIILLSFRSLWGFEQNLFSTWSCSCSRSRCLIDQDHLQGNNSSSSSTTSLEAFLVLEKWLKKREMLKIKVSFDASFKQKNKNDEQMFSWNNNWSRHTQQEPVIWRNSCCCWRYFWYQTREPSLTPFSRQQLSSFCVVFVKFWKYFSTTGARLGSLGLF